MPTTRSKAAARATQPTLSFSSRSNKVTKPSITQSVKDSKNAKAEKLPAAVDVLTPSPPEDVSLPIPEPPATAELAIREQAQAEKGNRDELEEKATKISDAQLKKYWNAKENERKAPRVHQQELTMCDKILREFDLSSQFGPCIGIARTKRWRRANGLGLDPPIEVLAVLLREDSKTKGSAQKAYVDELMSSRYIID